MRTPLVKAFEGTAAELVVGLAGRSPTSYGGKYVLLCGGKLGEVFFVTGLVRDLRRQLPSARIVLDCHPQYAFLPKQLRETFDAVESNRISRYWKGVYRKEGEIGVDVFRASPSVPGPPRVFAPFYRVFARSAGAAFRVPDFGDVVESAPQVLALPTMNTNASARGRLPFSPDQWADLAEHVRAAGHVPVATGAHGDGNAGSMPGWEWRDCGIADFVTLLRRSSVVLGGNSGVVFMAAAMGKRAIMLNDIGSDLSSWWDPSGMGDVPGMHAIRYLRLRPDGQDDARAFPFTQTALRDLTKTS